MIQNRPLETQTTSPPGRKEIADLLAHLKHQLTFFQNVKRDKSAIQQIQANHFVPEGDDLATYNLTFIRAAAYGDVAELETLMDAGVNINAVTEDGCTALHTAVEQNNALNVLFLLSLEKINIHINNQSGQTAADLAFSGNNHVIKFMFNDWVNPKPCSYAFNAHQHRALGTADILNYIFSMLPIDTLFNLRIISRFWKNCVKTRIDMLLKAESLTEDEIDQFYYLPKLMQYLICKCVLDWDGKGKLKRVVSVLSLTLEQRESRGLGFLISDYAVLLYGFGILIDDHLRLDNGMLCSQYSALALIKRLLSIKEILASRVNSTSSHDSNRLSHLLSRNGVIALSQKLMTPQQALKCSSLGFLVDVYSRALQALREGIITMDEICNLGSEGQRLLSSDLEYGPKKDRVLGGYEMLKAGLIKVADLTQTTHYNRLAFFEQNAGLIAIRDKIITREQLITIKDWKPVLSHHGLEALERRLITVEQINKIAALRAKSFKIIGDIGYLLSKNGIAALAEGLIKPDDAARIKDLYTLLSDNGLQALREKLFTIDQLENVLYVTKLLSADGLKALRGGEINFQEIKAPATYVQIEKKITEANERIDARNRLSRK